MIRRGFIVLALALLPVAASAHTLEHDGSIGAVLHVDPDDDPVVSQAAILHFDIKDKDGKFSSAACDCTLNVRQGNNLVHTEKTESMEAGVMAIYTFPERGAYTLELVGRPKVETSFQSFKLVYSLRVSRTDTHPGSDRTTLYLLGGVGVMMGGIVGGALITNQRRRTHSRKDT